MQCEKLDNAGGIDFTIGNLSIINSNTSNEASARLGSAVSVWRNTSLTTFPLGGLTIGNLYIDSVLSSNGLYFNDESATAIDENPLIINNVVRINSTIGNSMLLGGTVHVNNDPKAQLVKELVAAESATYNYSTSDYRRIVKTHTTKGTVVNLPAIRSDLVGTLIDLIMRDTTSSLSRIATDGTDRFLYLGKAAGSNFDTTQEGAIMRLKMTSAGWEVLQLTGSWT